MFNCVVCTLSKLFLLKEMTDLDEQVGIRLKKHWCFFFCMHFCAAMLVTTHHLCNVCELQKSNQKSYKQKLTKRIPIYWRGSEITKYKSKIPRVGGQKHKKKRLKKNVLKMYTTAFFCKFIMQIILLINLRLYFKISFGS